MGHGNRYKWINGKNVDTKVIINWLERRVEAISLVAFRIKKQALNLDWNS